MGQVGFFIPLKAKQKAWFNMAKGLRMDPDRAYDLQCVDVVDHYAEYIFGKPWQATVGGVNGAKDLLHSFNPKYWQVIANKPNNRLWIPWPGDALVFGGTEANPYGHTAVCVWANLDGAWVLQQNGDGLKNSGGKLEWLPYWGPGTGVITGWGRPRKTLIR
jgi:hypothetical protein